MDKVLAQLLDAIPAATIGAMLIAARAIMYENYREAKKLAVALFVALPSGIIAGGVAHEFGWGFYSCLAVTGLVVLLSEHIFILLVENPARLWEAIKEYLPKK